MEQYKALSNKELFNECLKQIKAIHRNVIDDFYPLLEDPEHKKIKVYQAIDRINMWIATEITKDTFYSYDINHYLTKTNRKMIKNILNGIQGLTYETVRLKWHSEHKELFYKQKNDFKIQEKLSKICLVARYNDKDGKEGFISITDEVPHLELSMANAIEFNAFSYEQDAIEYIKKMLKDKFEIDANVFFSKKVKGRKTYLKM